VARYFERHGYERIERYRAFDAVNSYFERRTREGAGLVVWSSPSDRLPLRKHARCSAALINAWVG
jgi:hypothetical protein